MFAPKISFSNPARIFPGLRLLAKVAIFAFALYVRAGFAQQAPTPVIPLKNWPVPKPSALPASNATTSGPVTIFISVTPCRVVDTRVGQGFTGAFGPPSLVGGLPRTIPIPESPCGLPVASAYSANVVSITAPGVSVGWVAA